MEVYQRETGEWSTYMVVCDLQELAAIKTAVAMMSKDLSLTSDPKGMELWSLYQGITRDMAPSRRVAWVQMQANSEAASAVPVQDQAVRAPGSGDQVRV